MARCPHCNGEGVLVSYECHNGREVDVTTPCEACDDGEESFRDREERLRDALDEHCDQLFEEGRERTLIAFGAGWCES